MKRTHKKRLLGATLVLLVGAMQPAQAQTSEALLEVLVRKGILTEQEAEDIKVELALENQKFNNVKAPGKTTQLIELSGDFRGRFEGFYADHDDWTDRNRWRYRLRVGLTAALTDRFKVGVRLASGEESGTFGSDPISRNATMQNNGSGKFIFIDQAYANFVALTNIDYTSSVTFGKMANPFEFSALVFDDDYTPEGVANPMNYIINEEHNLAFTMAAFFLDEIGGDSDDPYLLAAQLRHNGIWRYNEAHKPKLDSTIGLAGMAIANDQSLGNGAVPNINVGNSRNAAGNLTATFNPIVVDGALTYWLDSAPQYNGFFPISIIGTYMNNLAESSENVGYEVGVKLGKAGKKATWEVGYNYRFLEADAWYEELVDSDFGSYYAATPASFGQAGAGYRSGTNNKGHIVKVAYSPYNALTLSLKGIFTTLIDEPAGQADSDMLRVQADAVVKF